MKKILGISAFYHDSAAALTVGGKTIAAAPEVRFTRKKHTSDFPTNAIQYCLEETGLEINELDAVVFYDKPLLKLERLLETYYAFAPKRLPSFLKAVPLWFKEKIIFDSLKEHWAQCLPRTSCISKKKELPTRKKIRCPAHILAPIIPIRELS